MVAIRPLLLILAFLCFILSAIGIPSRVNLQSVGLAFWVASLLLL